MNNKSLSIILIVLLVLYCLSITSKYNNIRYENSELQQNNDILTESISVMEKELEFRRSSAEIGLSEYNQVYNLYKDACDSLESLRADYIALEEAVYMFDDGYTDWSEIVPDLFIGLQDIKESLDYSEGYLYQMDSEFSDIKNELSVNGWEYEN